MNETVFPTWDLTMISVDVFEKVQDLRNLIEWIKEMDFPTKWEIIANITLAIRHLEDVEYRILKAKQYIIESSNIEIN